MASQRVKGITIQIGGDTSNLVSALSKVDSAIKTTKTNLNDINKALKLDPTNTNLLAAKQKELGNAVIEAKEKVDKEKQAYEELQNKINNTPLDLDHAAEIQKDTEALEKLKLQIDLDTVALNEAEKASKDFGTVLGQQMQAVGQKVQEVGQKISDVGQGMTTKVTTPIVAGMGAAIKVTADFDSQMSKVQAISGAAGNEFTSLRDKAREMGASTKFSATEAGEAFEYMAMAGWKTDQMLEGVNGIMNLAAASGEELGTTSDIVTDALTAFGMTAEESGRFADILASAASNANTNVSMMGESFKYVAPVAGSLGYSAEDVAVALGLMANSGIKADMAGTSLRNMLNRMAKPTEESAMAMERLGLELYDGEGEMFTFREIMDQLRNSMGNINVDLDEYNAQLDQLDAALEDGTLTQKKYDAALEELNLQAFGAEGAEKARAAAMLGGTRAMAGLLAISNATTEDYEKLTSAIDNSSQAFAKLADGSVVPLNEALESGQEIIEQYDGTAEAMARTMENNLNGDLTVLKSMLQELAISLGDLLIPLAREVVGVIQNIVNYLNSLDDETKKTILTIAGVVAAVGPVLLVVGKLITGIGAVISAVGTIQAAIAAAIPVVTAIGGVITGTIIPAIVAIGAPVLAIVAAIAAVIAIIVLCVKHWDEIKEAAGKAVAFISEKWTQFKEHMGQLWDNIKAKTAETVENMSQKWSNFKDNVSNKWKETHDSINAVNNLIAQHVAQRFTQIRDNTIREVTSLRDGAVNLFNNLMSGISSIIDNIRNTIVNGFQNAISYITSLPSQAAQWGRDIINGLVDGIRNAFHNLVDAVSDIGETISSYIHFSEPDKGALSDFHTYMPDMMSQLAQGIRNGIPQIESAMSSLSSAMTPTMGAGNTTNNSNSVSVNVYGAQGQDVNELANIIEQKITDNVVRRGVAFG